VEWISPYTRQFDKDHSGHIEMVEVVTAMEAVGRKVHLADFMRVLGVVDGDMDQKISFAEFVNLFETAKLKKEMLAGAEAEENMPSMMSVDLDERRRQGRGGQTPRSGPSAAPSLRYRAAAGAATGAAAGAAAAASTRGPPSPVSVATAAAAAAASRAGAGSPGSPAVSQIW
jgi:hypothetical protein